MVEKNKEEATEQKLDSLSSQLDGILAGALKQNKALKKQNNNQNKEVDVKVSDHQPEASTEVVIPKEKVPSLLSRIWNRISGFISYFPSSTMVEARENQSPVIVETPQVQSQAAAPTNAPTKENHQKTWGDMFKDPFGLKELEEKRNEALQGAAESFKAAGTNLEDAKKGIKAVRENNKNTQKKVGELTERLERERAGNNPQGKSK